MYQYHRFVHFEENNRNNFNSSFKQKSSVKNKEITSRATRKTEKMKPLQIGICGPALYFYNEDISKSLVEWFELMRHSGFAKVFLYINSELHPNIYKVLNFYEDQGFLQITSFSYPPPYVNHPMLKRLVQIYLSMQSLIKIFLLILYIYDILSIIGRNDIKSE